MSLTWVQSRVLEAHAKRIRKVWDRGEDRAPVPQSRPGKFIGELQGKHSGKVAILFNGASLANHDLHRITVPIIGMNRTYVGYEGYKGPQPDYYCFVDVHWFKVAKAMKDSILINGSTDNSDMGYRATRCIRMKPFSFDLARDGYVAPIPCTTGHLALQLAPYLGFTDIYCLGLDMGGPHFDQTRASLYLSSANSYHMRQAPLIKERGLRVTICGSPESKCTAFPHSKFEELVA